MTKKEIILIENLTKRYSGFTAIEKLNLAINQNDCVGFLGPNGAGKTTTIKILTGLLFPTSGTAQLFGFDVTKDPKNALANVGSVVETPEFFPHLNPNEILFYFGKLRGLSSQTIREQTKYVMELVNMTEWGQKKVGKFSKGMKQRLSVAAALLHDPDLVILDEPTSGLDPRGMVEIRNIIKSLKKQNKTIFMSSHMLGETQEVCDKIALIDRGHLLRFDKIDMLNNQSEKSTIVIELLDFPNQDKISEISKFDGVKNVKYDSAGLVVEFVGGKSQKAELLTLVQQLGLKIVSFKSLDTELESFYMDLVTDSVG